MIIHSSAAATSNYGIKKQFTMPTILERFESKYTIPYSMIDEISSFIEPYCSLDNYSEIAPNKFYPVNSLYFDTPHFFFLQQRLQKAEKRFNMRIRSYGEQAVMPWFLEIKQRTGDVVKKYRSQLDCGDIKEILHAPEPTHITNENEKQFESRELFRRTIHQYNAQPLVLVQYMRKAYAADYNDYARVTFDVNLRYMPQKDYSPVPVEGIMTSCDTQNCFDSGCSVVLELKCYTSFVPLWMIDLVKAFDLKRQSFSKYANSVKPMLERHLFVNSFFQEPAIPLF